MNHLQEWNGRHKFPRRLQGWSLIEEQADAFVGIEHGAQRFVCFGGRLGQGPKNTDLGTKLSGEMILITEVRLRRRERAPDDVVETMHE